MTNHIFTLNVDDITRNVALLIDDLNASITWVTQWISGPNKKSSLSKLKEIRRELKKINYAIQQNTTAALFGESQVGKSYLIKILLSDNNSRLKIKNHTTNKKVDWLRYINPDGKGMESTSIITRFSTRVDVVDQNYPLTAKLVSPKDVVLILLDSFFNDLETHVNRLDHVTISQSISDIEELLETYPSASQSYFTEDDIQDVKKYLNKHFNNKVRTLDYSGYWDLLTGNIHRIACENWSKVFEILWGKNELISNIFNRMIEQLSVLDFAEVIYLEFQSVLKQSGTLLNVHRIKDINSGPRSLDMGEGEEYEPTVKILYFVDKVKVEKSVEKSLLCAVIEELVFKIDKALEKSRPIIKHTDLLDFPGAKPRLLKEESNLSENDDIGEMLLRGKVAYAFNKYSENYLISNLLFCHNDRAVTAKYLPKLLDGWIQNHIGEDEERREALLSKRPVPPLFIIFTFFNNQLKYDPILDKGTDANLTKRWKSKFNDLFEDQLIEQKWHTKWRISEPFFQNFFMLRDFEKSTDTFSGFNADSNQPEKRITAKNKVHLDRLKTSFVDFDFVNKHFEDPNASWEESASIQKDGSGLIIEKLSKVSDSQIRNRMLVAKLNDLMTSLKKELKSHFYDKKQSKKIESAYQVASNIQREADVYFFHNKEKPFLFGRFVQQFLIKEKDVYNLFSDALSDPKILLEQGITNYTAIIIRCPEINRNKKFKENLKILERVYGFQSLEETKEYFERKKIDLDYLFYSEEKKQKKTSLMLAEILRDYWFSKHLDIDQFNFFTKGEMNFATEELEQLIENMKLSFNKKVELHELIAKEISEMVDRGDNKNNSLPMIADISARLINKFVNTMGVAFYTTEHIDKIKAISTNNPELFSLDFDFENEIGKSLSEAELVELFEDVNRYEYLANNTAENRERLKKFPALKRLQMWSDFIKISFMGNCEASNFNIVANNVLEKIIHNVEQYNFLLNKE